MEQIEVQHILKKNYNHHRKIDSYTYNIRPPIYRKTKTKTQINEQKHCTTYVIDNGARLALTY